MRACVCHLPQVAFVGGVLDVVTDVVVHSMGCCAVSGIKNLESGNKHSEPDLCTVITQLLRSSKYTI